MYLRDYKNTDIYWWMCVYACAEQECIRGCLMMKMVYDDSVVLSVTSLARTQSMMLQTPGILYCWLDWLTDWLTDWMFSCCRLYSCPELLFNITPMARIPESTILHWNEKLTLNTCSYIQLCMFYYVVILYHYYVYLATTESHVYN